MKYSTILWDFDGTLFDTYPSMNKTFQLALKEEFNIEEDLETIWEWTHVSIGYCADVVAHNYNLSKDEISKAYHDKYYNASMPFEQNPMEGANEICQFVCKNGGINLIFTHRRYNSTKKLLEKHGFMDYIEEIVSPDIGHYHKPSPEMLFYFIDKYGLDPKNCLVVGDRQLDIETGINAEIDGCFFTPTREECTISKYNIISLRELENILQS